MEFNKINSKIFIISGKSGTGKTKTATIIKKILEKENKKVICLSYADSLNEYAKNILNWNGKEETKPKQFLQEIGTNLIREKIDSKLLIRRMIENIKVYSYFYDIIIINDAIYLEEIVNIKNVFYNTKVIRIEKINNELNVTQKNHITETALDTFNGYDYIIDNNNTIEKLTQKIVEVVKDENFE
ncbi:MAG: hypothetical protein ACK5HP_00690 [Bacilli bacterium]